MKADGCAPGAGGVRPTAAVRHGRYAMGGTSWACARRAPC